MDSSDSSMTSMADGFFSGYGTPVWSPKLTPASEPQYIGAIIGLFILSIGFRGLAAAQGYLEAFLHLHYYPRPTSHSHSSSSSHSRIHTHPHALQQSQSQYQQLQPEQQQQQDETVAELQQAQTPEEKSHDSGLSYIKANHKVGLQDKVQGDGALQQADELHGAQPTTRFRRYRQHRPSDYHNSYEQPTAPHPFLLPTVQPFVWQAEVLRAVLTTGVIGIGYMLMLVIMTYNSAYFGAILAGVFVGEVYFGRWSRVRPIFPSRATKSVIPGEKTSYQQQNFTVGISTSISSSGRNNVIMQSPRAPSMHSLNSKSSYGFSSTMVHHGASVDGC
ncbi:hypothetical protein BGZ80_003693 [Entomortierella chlamydospora]|uniref:Copper transport protein n=1 Tax=Entomortierella chlamydospora TaxID=101097 RepID=A0A9P6SWI2_9FUNG|nr:hypothetical protein BGZ79_008182 [Entomortierella chlamydospora]KAG0008213.1 hypothetical protein BGZ80_003693 [Entomortierella chlamydospora]